MSVRLYRARHRAPIVQRSATALATALGVAGIVLAGWIAAVLLLSVG